MVPKFFESSSLLVENRTKNGFFTCIVYENNLIFYPMFQVSESEMV